MVQLAAAGKVGLYRTLGGYVDGFPADIANNVTVHQLLTHTSGIEDFMRSDAWWQASSKWKTPEEAFDGTLSVLRKLPLTFTPGTSNSYSNSNYFLAGAIVARVSGLHFRDYIPRHIFGPASMSSTGFLTGRQWLTDPRVVHNYGPRQAGGRRIFGHTGGLGVLVPGSSIAGGGSTSLSVYPGLDVVAVVLSNYFLYPGIGVFLREQDRIITGT